MKAPALALAAVWLVATTLGPTADTSVNDLFVYRAYAGLLADGRLPYRDFAFEYPPLAVAPIAAGGLAGLGAAAYGWSFGALMLAAALGVQRATAALAGSHARAAAWTLVALPVLAGAMVRTHFDLVPVALALAGLALVLRDRPATGFALLALGTATKLFPVVVAAVAFAWLAGAGRTAEARRGVLAFAAVLALACGPFVALAPEGFGDQLVFHAERPVQIESTPATVLWLAGDSFVTGDPVRPDPYKSNGLDGGPAGAVELAFALLLATALAASLVLAHRAPHDRASLVRAALAALLAFVSLSKVLSPQYLLWLAPLAAAAWWSGARAAAAAVGVALVLTQLEFPARYFQLVAGDGATIALVAARNAALLVALGLTLAPLAAPARWRRPAAASPSRG